MRRVSTASGPRRQPRRPHQGPAAKTGVQLPLLLQRQLLLGHQRRPQYRTSSSLRRLTCGLLAVRARLVQAVPLHTACTCRRRRVGYCQQQALARPPPGYQSRPCRSGIARPSSPWGGSRSRRRRSSSSRSSIHSSHCHQQLKCRRPPPAVSTCGAGTRSSTKTCCDSTGSTTHRGARRLTRR